MIQLTPTTRIFIHLLPIDMRKGIDGLGGICRQALTQDPTCGALFLFRGRQAKALKMLIYDGQGFWLLQKRLSQGTFKWWPRTQAEAESIGMYELYVLLGNGDPTRASIAQDWRRVS